MKEDRSTLISKKIRNILIYYTYLDIKKNLNAKNGLLINSLTSYELNNKYQKSSDYCVQKIEIYTSSQMNNGIDNNNYFHVSLTYSSSNNNYRMLVDNKNVEQYIGKNNIVGKYYKGDTIQIGTTTDQTKYNISLNKDRLEKKIIGENKFMKKHRNSLSSEKIENIHIIDNCNKSEINEYIEYLDTLRSNNNDENYKKLVKETIERIETNCENKKRKRSKQKINKKYMIKLKKYCSSLIKLERKRSSISSINNRKVPLSPTTDKKRKNKKDKNSFRSTKIKPKIPILSSNENIHINIENKNSSNVNIKIYPENRKNQFHKTLKNQTRMITNVIKIQTRSSFFRKHKSIEIYEEHPKKKTEKKIFSPKNIFSPKKIFSPKNKNFSPKKENIFEFNSGPLIPTKTSKFFNLYQKFSKKEKDNDVNIKIFTSGNNKIDFPPNKRKVNNHTNVGNSGFKVNNKNEKVNTSSFRDNKFHITKKGRYKKSKTINKAFKFKSGEAFGKKKKTVK